MTAGRVLPARMDPLSPEVVDDPYPTYARVRAAGPLCRFGPASWGVTRHRDVAALLRDRRLSNTFPEDDPQFRMARDLSQEVFRRIIPTRDPDDHSRLHQQMVRAFSPGVARRTAARIGALVDELLTPALDTGRLDAVADLAFPVAATVVCELIGLPAARTRAEVWPRSAALGRAFTPFLPETDRAAVDALVWLRGYVRDLLDGHRPDPDGDLLDRMLAVADPAEGVEEVVDNIVFLCFTGYETTMNMVCTGSVALARNPDEWRRLRADPSLSGTAAEEFVRYDAPIQYTARLALEPIPVGDRVIRPGRSVFLLLGCANRDEDVFADPDRIDIGRRPNPHVGFGGGVRGCLGAALARVEGAVIFERLARRFATVDLAAAPVREPSALFRSYASIPLAVTPA
ncbi:cytochrome P450 [Micromonospora globbae]|jgi:cytochrome P450|uniref:Cytochrome P450 n=1 Tax=Micromonospora globbae TaxID=1894969 RepID=A0A420EX82_9ACTN|nr:cytochrome P450 [Micromonospora globbae]RKF24867.1 cytochrome P450 [Micromonospora globbae]WTF83646.1 cytochrome P450 [Micromonospora globbae]